MPEIAEVHRVVHFIRKHVVGRTVTSVKAQEDSSVFGKVGTSAEAFEKAMEGKKIVGAGQQGKYFWLEMSSPPHPVLHLGMTGWFHIRDMPTYYYKDTSGEAREWPPRFWKFELQLDNGGAAAYADARRFGRVRLVDCKASALRQTTPLKENGPDPVADPDAFTREYLAKVCANKKVPIKALLLDQANISGIGNWVGDEVLYYARIHPEQYCNTLSAKQVETLYDSIRHICITACDLLADSEKFPEEWLFRHRWGKGKKDSPNRLPSGEKIVFLTVGGRTSAVVPSLQKKTGPVAKEVDEAEVEDEVEDEKPKKGGNKRKHDTGKTEEEAPNGKVKEEPEDEDTKPKIKRGRKAEEAAVNGSTKAKVTAKLGGGTKGAAKTSKAAKEGSSLNEQNKQSRANATLETERRRSGRLSRG